MNLLHKPTFDRLFLKFTDKQRQTIEVNLPTQSNGVCTMFWHLAITVNPAAAMRYLNVILNYERPEPESLARTARAKAKRKRSSLVFS